LPRASHTYSEHLQSIKGCGTEWRILYEKKSPDKPTSLDYIAVNVVPARCKSSSCFTCARIYFKKIRYKLRSSILDNSYRFFTLTTLHQQGNEAQELLDLEIYFSKLKAILRKQNKSFKYFAVKELSPSGMWHIHGLWNIYIDLKELSSIWKSISGAYRCNLQKVRNPIGVINYIYSYLLKNEMNATEKELLYANGKRKFTYSNGFFIKEVKSKKFFLWESQSQNVTEVKEELIKIIEKSLLEIDKFSSKEWPYFNELIENIFKSVYEEAPEPPLPFTS